MTAEQQGSEWHEHDAAGCTECDCASAPMNSAPCTCPMTAEHSSEEGGEGLSEAERQWGREGYGVLWFEQRNVERILADRLAAVQAALTTARREADEMRAERDALQLQLGEQADIEREAFGRGVEWASGAGMRQRWEATEAERDDLRGRLAKCSRCGERDVLNRRPHDDIVVCEPCMHEVAEDLRADAWDEGHRFTGYEPERGENPYRAALANPSAAQGEGEA